MRITKKQLRRIIKEERAKLQKEQLNESVTDMRHYEDMIETASFDISERFMKDMDSLYEEQPESFQGTGAEWSREVMAASSELDRRLSLEMADSSQRN